MHTSKLSVHKKLRGWLFILSGSGAANDCYTRVFTVILADWTCAHISDGWIRVDYTQFKKEQETRTGPLVLFHKTKL